MSFPIDIDGRTVTASAGETILDVARREGIFIPTLCFDERLHPFGACRVCMVGVEGARGPVAACTTPCREGMQVDTRDARAIRVAKGVVELVLSDFPVERLETEDKRNELQRVAAHFGLKTSRYQGERHAHAPDLRHPYIKLHLDECIVCGRCVRACDEVQGAFALAYSGRGFGTKIVAGLDTSLAESSCVSCGACVSACPTGALDEAPFRATAAVDRTVTTTCAYCGVGCRLEAHVRDDKVVAVDPALDGPANKGHTCVKGRFAHQFTVSDERLKNPLIRTSTGFRDASWDEALDLVASTMLRIKREHGPDAIAGISSSRCTNEENYLLMKLMRAAVGTHNVDNCSRVCHSPSSFGLIQGLGKSGGTNPFDDIERAKVIFVTGANPTEAHPVVGARIKQAVLGGARLIVSDPRRIELAGLADRYLQLRPGANVALFNALAHVIVEEGLHDRAFVEEWVEGVEPYFAFIQRYAPEAVEATTGVPAKLVREAARLYATGGAAAIFYGLGITEHSQGAPGVQCLVNLAILTGNLGKPGAGVNPLRGQNNVQGGSDSGSLPNVYSMYQPVTDEAAARKFEDAWGVKMKRKRGLMIPEMFDAAIDGRLRALYVFGEDVAHTDPNTTHVLKALTSLELLVCQEIFLSETAKLAHVVLPGSAFLEKTGTFTNAERRIQLVNAAARPPGDAWLDFDILRELSRRLGYEMAAKTPSEVMDEMARLSPDIAGVSYDRLGRSGLQWPVPHKDHPGTPMLFGDVGPDGRRFGTASGKARLSAVDWAPPGEEVDPEYPFILVTGRQLAHYNAGTMTRRTANLELHPSDLAEIHPDDAARLGVADGDEVEVASRRGSLRTFAKVTTRVAPGNLFMSFHFPELQVNLLTSSHADAATSCPEYKVSAVALRRIAAGEGRAKHGAHGIHHVS
ncbi:MAG: formate dehydrogenase subunit alpha [Deltaproteobacteria bacterium]|nr:formate dehydrogenase subunit alpha [Deltaproteobacteria bacterium]